MLNKPKPPYLGAAYYPEVWDIALIDEDIAKMKEAGFNCARIAEFAWSSLEPSEGVFDFSVFKTAIDKLYNAGIAVVMCTPSATPPKWLTDKYEETLLIDSLGKRAQFGGRCHVCKTSEIMREKNRTIVTKMCEQFAHHPAIIGWQIDNEIYPYKDGCFCQLCKAKFVKFLEDKYKTIENLNSKWGTKRWSLDYQSFKDIISPRSDTWNHPSLEVEWLRFGSDNIISYVEQQSEIIRKYFDVPIGTDMMPMHGTDYYKINKNLDIVQFNHYEPDSALGHASFWFDFMRPIKEQPFWNTETQAGWPGNKAAGWGLRATGNCRVNTWLPVAKGGEMNLYWHWRAHFAGHELHHGSIISTAGRFYHIIDEIKQTSDDFEKCAELLNSTKVESKIALSMSASSWLNLQYAPMVDELNYTRTLYSKYHKYLAHYNVDVIDTPHDLSGYKVLISPFLTHADENGFKTRVLDWVEKGGKWIVGPMTDIYTDYAAKYQSSPYSFLEDVAGIFAKYQVPLKAEGKLKAEWLDKTELATSDYFEGYELKGAKSLAAYTTDCLNGLSAITEKKYGKGSIIVTGTVVTGNDLLKLIDMKPILNASGNVELVKRTVSREAIICIELENIEGYVELDRQYTDILTGNKLSGKINIKPLSVMVLV